MIIVVLSVPKAFYDTLGAHRELLFHFYSFEPDLIPT
jgi:hypothetical protein